MGISSRIKELLKKGGEEAARKSGSTFKDLSEAKKKELYRNIAGGSTTTEMVNKNFTRTQIATARENIRTSKGGKGAETLKKAAKRGEKRTAEKAKKAEKAARETVVQTGSVGTKSVSKKPSIAVSRPRGGTMADTRQNVMRETKEAGRSPTGAMQYEKTEIKLKDNRPTRAQQIAAKQKPVTKSESGKKAAASRKEREERQASGAAKVAEGGDLEAFFKKLPGGEQQSLLRAANGSESKLAELIQQRMNDAMKTEIERLARRKGGVASKNYRKGGAAMKGKK